MKHATVFALSELQRMPPIDGWQEFMRDGNGFLQTAIGGYAKRQDVFTSGILYNLIAMAIEKFVMAALMRHGAMPYNHTLKDLVEAIDGTFPGAVDEIREGLLAFDDYQDICDLEGFNITPPGMEKIPGMLDLGRKMQTFAAIKTRGTA